jgi:hypothetical protein
VGYRAAAAGSLILGGQGVYVLLTSGGTSYNGTSHIFTTSVTLKNLTAGPLGTSDGSVADPAGIRVFFHSGPTAVGGGSVAVANQDGSASFTGVNQPYFQYPGILGGGATSGARTWNFNVSGTVTSFTFQVLVASQVPQPAGILRFLYDSLGTEGSLRGVFGTSGTNVYAVGVFTVEELLGGQVFRWNGSSWTSLLSVADLLYGVYAVGSTVLAVGPDGIIQYSSDNGAHWTRTRLNSGVLLNSAWGSGPTDLFAAGGSGGTIVHSPDGVTWTPMTSNATAFLNQVWGTSATDVYAVGYSGNVVHYNGSSWTKLTVPAASAGTIFYGIGGVAGGEAFAVGDGGTILHTTNFGANWAAQASGTTNVLRAVWCVSAGDCLATGDTGTLLHWNGSSWSPMTSGATTVLRGTWGASSAQLFVAGDAGTVLRGIR